MGKQPSQKREQEAAPVAAAAPLGPRGTKHLIECQCVLPHLKHTSPIVFHRFVVFSTIDEAGNVKTKHVRCDNCGAVHRVHELCRSEIMLGRDDIGSIIGIEDVRPSLPAGLASLLDGHHATVATWEECQHVLDEGLWGRRIVLRIDRVDGLASGKTLVILSPDRFRIEPFNHRLDADLPGSNEA